MSRESKSPFTPLFSNPLEPYPGLTINDLNRYLPAVRTVDDIKMTPEGMSEGLFLAETIEGLQKLPDNTIDLLIAKPPEDPWANIENSPQKMTLQDFYQWNEKWLQESMRVLQPTGAIYLLCGWRYSGMYHALLNDHFKIQSRITWNNKPAKGQGKSPTWLNQSSDIWFATKSNDFLFNQNYVQKESLEMNWNDDEISHSNFWADIRPLPGDEHIPDRLLNRILKASSFKLNWVLDPFLGEGIIGRITKKSGRRFIGFGNDKDKLLMAMKKIDQS
ncbi:MAG: site-specific DNA-methyltransferase [Candidatus Marinimicrobia bacterium]|jgi:site-specific DNA-methyltransferase (adenine-specific)|nr:site-specific DNA-methyltransferase [Candidatus Neomarinimicrobiota bacterium]MBT3497124.1 site-specific DNA-methyltransferase [Candidatus Neomarinimicrobiota bacterium]MBT3692097.1 site-specific DNA-methyltransferase [Candidatus Neomarinimicrobiota bacterium]MBT3732010.1 site-specific DNA-methyltransferase [Candidatus Neomarinimicrobiota bacterium]MBT4144182.1 site-specific DNA-methyltransferase [Candidatus Neomarinimicrobiota bacterium]